MLQISATFLGVLMSVGYFPQAYIIWKNKSARGVSLLSFSIFSVGTTVWTLYGISTNDNAIIASFAVGMIGSWMVLLLALKYRDEKGNSSVL